MRMYRLQKCIAFIFCELYWKCTVFICAQWTKYLLRIATENNTYLGTWRIFAGELGVKTRGCVSILTHSPLILETKYMLILNISLPFVQKSKYFFLPLYAAQIGEKRAYKWTYARFSCICAYFFVLRTSALALINPLKMLSLSKPIPP